MWDGKDVDIDFFKSFNINQEPSHSTITFFGNNYELTISNKPNYYKIYTRLFKQKTA